MEAMHSSDLVFFRRLTPSPIPRIVASTAKDSSTDVYSDAVEEDTPGQGASRALEVPASPGLNVSSHDKRRLQIQKVREMVCCTVTVSLLHDSSCLKFNDSFAASLLHESRKSSFIQRTSYLSPPTQNLTTCHLSNSTSTILILSPPPLSLLLSFFFHFWGFV